MTKILSKSVICLDLGNKRIGLAGCDPLGLTITRLPAIIRKESRDNIDKLKEICANRKAQGIIFGLPLDEKGNETYQSNKCRKEGLMLAKALTLPYSFVNEHSSTWEAKDKFNLYNDKSGKLDSGAAAILLQQWLREGPELKSIS